MSFIDFKEVSVNNPGSSIRYGGDDLKQLMQILNGKIVAQKRPRIINEWIWLDHFDMAPPAVVPAAPTDTNASRIYTDPTSFKVKVKKTNDSIVDIENVDIPDSALAAITNRTKLPGQIAYDDEANVFTLSQTISRTAQAATAELIQQWKTSDSSTHSFIQIENGSTTDNLFLPQIKSKQGGTSSIACLNLFIETIAGGDLGTVPLFVTDVRITPSTAIATRPLYEFRNNGTAVFKLTATEIDHTNKTLINPGNVMLNTLDNNLGDHYVDFGDIAAPGNPAAGIRRVFNDSATGELSVRTSAGATISLESIINNLDAISDVIITTPALNEVLTYNGTNWVNAVPPGAAGGEANTVSNIGSGGIGIFKNKVGVDLKFKKINAGSNKITIVDDTGNDEVDINVAEANFDLSAMGGTISDKARLTNLIAYTDQVNTFGDFNQIFRSSKLLLRDSDDSHSYIFAGSNLTADRTVTWPLLTANDNAVTEAFPQPLSNKTIDADVNTITNIEDADIKAHTSTKITITAKAQLATAIAYEDETNTFTSAQTYQSYHDFAKITAPADPAAETARTYYKEINANNNAMVTKEEINGAIREVLDF